jgi:hypothetical protein
LLGRSIEEVGADDGFRVGRITFDLRRPVPIGPIKVATQVVRSGRTTRLVTADLIGPGGDSVVAATGLLVLGAAEIPVVPGLEPPAGPDEGAAKPFFEVGNDIGYHTAMDWRFVEGGFREIGPATCWMRMRMPLVPGEEPSPLVRTLVAADSGNGISGAVDWKQYTFVNADYTVHVYRAAVGEWIGLAARTSIYEGIGLTDTALYDPTGSTGRAAQTLLVRGR